MVDAKQRFGSVDIIGLPNAGKSTLINQLTGRKIAAVTHKVQTTRSPLRAIATFGATQAILIDTPGVFKIHPSDAGAKAKSTWGEFGPAEVTLLVVDAALRDQTANRTLAAEVHAQFPPPHPTGLVLNKIDRISKERLLPLMAEFNDEHGFDVTVPVSARSGEGCAVITDWLSKTLPLGPWHYPEDQIADAPMTAIAAEITREKAMVRLHDEIPYGLSVEPRDWQTRPDGSVRVKQCIVVARETHRRMAIGKAGRTVAAIGRAARTELGELLDQPVHLELRVELRANLRPDGSTTTPAPPPAE